MSAPFLLAGIAVLSLSVSICMNMNSKQLTQTVRHGFSLSLSPFLFLSPSISISFFSRAQQAILIPFIVTFKHCIVSNENDAHNIGTS